MDVTIRNVIVVILFGIVRLGLGTIGFVPFLLL